MSDFTMKVGGVEIVALSDMNLPFPMPLTQLFPTAPAEAWEPYKQLYPDAFEQDHMLIEIGCYLVRSEGQTILHRYRVWRRAYRGHRRAEGRADGRPDGQGHQPG